MKDTQGFPEIAIIGPGKVGTALGMLAARAGLRVVAVGGRDPDRTAAAAKRISPAAQALSIEQAAAAAGLVLLTVSDDAIAKVCGDLAAKNAFRRGAIVAHCSGAYASDVLAPAKERCACAIGAMHPFQTFPTVESAVAHLSGAYCFCDGDAAAVAALRGLAEAISGKPVEISAAGKTLFHAAAVTASNYLVSLMEAAVDLAERAGVDRATAWAAMEPLVRATVDNVSSLGPAKALTGPIARGDVETVRRHLEALRAEQVDLRVETYLMLGMRTVLMAVQAGRLDPETAGALYRLFTDFMMAESGKRGPGKRE